MGTIARRHVVSATIRTGSGSSVSAEIAPIHVGATWRPTGSGRPRPVMCVAAVPSSRRMSPGTWSRSSTIELARRELVRLGDRQPLGELLVVDAVEEVDPAQLRER